MVAAYTTADISTEMAVAFFQFRIEKMFPILPLGSEQDYAEPVIGLRLELPFGDKIGREYLRRPEYEMAVTGTANINLRGLHI